MRAYSMDLRERALLDSDAGMTAADVAAKYRVSGSWVRLLKQRRRETGEVAPRVQRQGRRGMLEPHLHTLADLRRCCMNTRCGWGGVARTSRDPVWCNKSTVISLANRRGRVGCWTLERQCGPVPIHATTPVLNVSLGHA